MWVCFFDERWGWEVNSLRNHLIPVLFGSTCSTFLLLWFFFVFSQLWFLRNVIDDITRLHLIVHIHWMDSQLYITVHQRESLIKQALFQIQPLELIRLLRIIFCWENWGIEVTLKFFLRLDLLFWNKLYCCSHRVRGVFTQTFWTDLEALQRSENHIT